MFYAHFLSSVELMNDMVGAFQFSSSRRSERVQYLSWASSISRHATHECLSYRQNQWLPTTINALRALLATTKSSNAAVYGDIMLALLISTMPMFHTAAIYLSKLPNATLYGNLRTPDFIVHGLSTENHVLCKDWPQKIARISI